MDTQALRALFDSQIRRGTPGRAGPDRVVRLVEDGPHGWAGVIWSDLDEASADAAICAQAAWATRTATRAAPRAATRAVPRSATPAGPRTGRQTVPRTGPLAEPPAEPQRGGETAPGAGSAARPAAPTEFEWKLYSHDRPADLGARLRAAGFVPEPPETVMVAEAAELAARPQPVLPDGLRVLDVTDAAGADLAADVHEKAFGASAERLRGWMREQLDRHPDLIRIVLAVTAQGEPVCAARTEFHPGTDFASLWGGGTVAAWRGRGIYRALVFHRARQAAARGVRYVQVDAADTSRPILERLGFTALTVTTPYVLRPGDRAAGEDG